MDVYKTDTELNEVAIREDILQKITSKEAIRWFQEKSFSYRKLMAYYRCAIMEVETKFNVLNEEFSLQYDRNPISSIKSRLKSFYSIQDKLQRNGFPLTVEHVEEKSA